MVRHPFESIHSDQERYVFWPAFALFLILSLVFRAVDVPRGIMAFELAGSVATAQEIVATWDKQAQLMAAFGLGIDFLYMVAYSIIIALACIWAARALARRGWPLVSLGAPLAYGLWLAALCDAIENVALMAQLLNGVSEPYPQIAAICATLKFSLIIVGLLYVIYGVVGRLAGRRPLAEGG